jgi:ATP-dependent DNA ligase
VPCALPNFTALPLQRRRDPFDHRDWLYELKLDGFRALAYVEGGRGRLVSRNGNTFKRFTPLAAESAVALGGVSNTILDGEVVCLDGDGRPLFNALLYRRSEPCFVAFDCLWLDGCRVLLRARPWPVCSLALTTDDASISSWTWPTVLPYGHANF